ncbi:MAG TPA: C-type lectin domain-containing protein [Polyangiaceae bacterium]|nr:C-type lectin domain-containing protein [Polyangiaceae bacterium]
MAVVRSARDSARARDNESAPARWARFGWHASRWLVAGWLIAGWACTTACTLTEDSFEPTRVDGAKAGGVPTVSPAPPGSDAPEQAAAAEQSSVPVTETNSEAPPTVTAPPRQTSMISTSGGSGGSAGSAASAPDAGAPVSSRPGQNDSGAVAVADAGMVATPPASELCTGMALEGSCFELFDAFAVWDVAEQQCVAWGGHLASIQSPTEDATIMAWWAAQLGLANADGTGIWLGGTDAQSDGTFAWVDGSSFAYTDWQPGQPDDGAGVDCVEQRNDGAGRWYDRRCTDALRYICKRPL